MKWFVAVILAVFSLPAGPGGAQLPPRELIEAEERLWTAVISGGAGPPAKEEKALRYQISALHASPSDSSPVVARVFEERLVGPDLELVLRWSVERSAGLGEPLPWPDAIYAFDYGLHVEGVQRRGNWVRLLSSIPVDGWLRINTEPEPQNDELLYVYVTPLDGGVFHLEPLMAQWPDGSTRHITGGDYLIQKVAGGFVEFREEVPSDYSCGLAVIDPEPLPPSLRAATSEFFSRDGTARFATKYTKGC